MAKEPVQSESDRVARAWFDDLVQQVVLTLRQPSNTQSGVTISAEIVVERWEAGGVENGWYATLGECTQNPTVLIDLWLDRYLGPNSGLRVGCWAMSKKQRTVDAACERAGESFGDLQRVGPGERNPRTELVKPRVASALERDLTRFIVDSWSGQYFIGRYFAGGMDEAREALSDRPKHHTRDRK